MGAWQVYHPRQVRQEVAELLLHLFPTKFVIGMLQVVVGDQISAPR